MGGSSHADDRLVSLVLATIAVAGALAALPAAGAVGAPGPADGQERDAPPDVDTYAVTQGGNCVEVTPFGDDTESVAAFYEYGLHTGLYSSQGTREYQEFDESQLFLYDGSEGGSVVFVHGEAGSGVGGGVATMRLSGVSPAGEWAVRDDNYTTRMDNFTHDGTSARADWWWGSNRTDGGAFRGLERGDYEAVTVDPAFNQAAPYWTLDTPTTINDWLLRSADGRTIQLSKTTPVTIRPGTCSGASTHVTANGTDGFAATVRNATAANGTTFRPALSSDAGVGVDRVAVDHGDGSWFQFGLNRTNASAAADTALPADPLFAVTPESDALDDGGLDGVEYTFAVDRDRLADRPVHPGDLALFQYRDGEWRRLDRDLERRGGEVLLRTTDAEGTAPVAVGALQPSIRVTDLSLSADTASPGEDVEITATVTNDGEGNGTYVARLTMFDQTVDRRSVRVPPGADRRVTFTRSVASPGTYTVTVDDARTELVVEGSGGVADLPSDSSVPPTLIVGAVLAVAVAAVVGYRAR
ncbi:CARDB domain-containing protein [Halostella salina]|uniref:CARDB domain-containing protein n=1 Tax=Halostella salina TaxID=1547897 RepID=UPI000EF84ABD|nr:CARDB domain-containing protein [Halostella salina]